MRLTTAAAQRAKTAAERKPKPMKCCLCEQYEEIQSQNWHTLIKGFAVCYACYSDMDLKTETAFHKFVGNLIRMMPKDVEIKASAFKQPFNFV